MKDIKVEKTRNGKWAVLISIQKGDRYEWKGRTYNSRKEADEAYLNLLRKEKAEAGESALTLFESSIEEESEKNRSEWEKINMKEIRQSEINWKRKNTKKEKRIQKQIHEALSSVEIEK